ncbi:MAG: hypothetical protein MJZ30_06655 [Paludibacteraceae bacterium]|nr:hypothetical protein [Paludibacteraceae bacterium]
MKKLIYILSLVVLPFSAIASSMKGDGTLDNPYLISSSSHLSEVAQWVNKGNSCEGLYFVLDQDLKMPSKKWTPIGDFMHPFAGHFDGANHCLNNLALDGGNFAGLFGCLSPEAVVENLSITTVSARTNYYLGAICGMNEGQVLNCHIGDGALRCYIIVGGIAGVNMGIVKDCSNNALVSSCAATGGIVGFNYGEVVNCTNTANSDGEKGNGGIVGYNGGYNHIPCEQYGHEQAFVDRCVNLGLVEGDSYTGGICGRNDGYISNCKNGGEVKSITLGGGIAGVNGSLVNADGYIYNSFNEGSVSAEDSVAGAICAVNTAHGTIDNVFNLAKLTSVEPLDSTSTIDTLSALLIFQNEGQADHLREVKLNPQDSTYLEALDSVITLLNKWVDASDLYPVYSWVLADSVLSFGEVHILPTEVEDVVTESQFELSAGGVWLSPEASVYTVKGELIQYNRSRARRFVYLKPGLYIMNQKRVLVVSD